jgi:hypothetical protein
MRALLVVLLVVGFLARYAVWIAAVLGAVVVFVAVLWWRSVWRAASIPSMRNTPCWWTAPISNTPGYSPAATVAGTANTRRTKIVPSAAARDGPGGDGRARGIRHDGYDTRKQHGRGQSSSKDPGNAV